MRLLALFLTVLIVVVLGVIPLIGQLVALWVLLTGLGGLTTEVYRRYRAAE